MVGEKEQYPVDYLVKRTGKPWEAKIFERAEEVAEIRRGPDLTYTLSAKDGRGWRLDPKVHGEIRPFSLLVTSYHKNGSTGAREEPVLAIREHLFQHREKFYMLTNSPEGRPVRDFLLGKRYVCRLDNFPFKGVDQLDHETRSRLRRFRGVPVGEMEGLGVERHRVRLSRELEDVGLLLAASSYLLYSTA